MNEEKDKRYSVSTFDSIMRPKQLNYISFIILLIIEYTRIPSIKRIAEKNSSFDHQIQNIQFPFHLLDLKCV